MSELAALLLLVNKRHGTRWSLGEKLPGGSQQGAYLLHGPLAERAVLKWHRRDLAREQLEAAATAIEEARTRGWPTPQWLAYGQLPDGAAYIIEELIEGSRPTRLEGRVLERLLEANHLQADAHPQTSQDWSRFIYRVVFEGEGGFAARMRDRPELAALLKRLERLTSGARDLELPTTDLVHGDFVLSNMIVRDGQPYLVDAAHAGKGTRAYDLATLLMETSVGGDYTAPSDSDRRRLDDACVGLVGRNGLLLCITCRMMLLLVFGGDHWGDNIPPMVARCHAFLDALEER